MNLNLTLFAQAVVFLAFIGFTIKFVWPPMLRAIEARQKNVADGLAAADQGRKSLESSAKVAADEIQAARTRAAEILGQAEKRASQMIETAKAAAKEESGREKAAAKAEIEQDVSRARETLREQVASLAVAGAEKILRREVNAQSHTELLQQLKKEL